MTLTDHGREGSEMFTDIFTGNRSRRIPSSIPAAAMLIRRQE